jgi:hypothetical protein
MKELTLMPLEVREEKTHEEGRKNTKARSTILKKFGGQTGNYQQIII